jgi:hypothetical protein
LSLSAQPGTRRFLLTQATIACLVCAGSAADPNPSPKPLQRTLSASGQFAVHGGKSADRLAVARRADRLREAWRTLMGLNETHTWPVIIRLAESPSHKKEGLRTALFLGDGDTIKIQIDVPRGIPAGADLELEIIRALALEYAYREARPREGKPYTLPPSWLIEGLWQEITGRETGLSSALFAQLVKAGPPPKLEALVRQRPEAMDPTSRAVYRAQAMTLLRALLASQEGRQGLASYLSALHATRPNDPAALLAAYPSLNEDPGALVKLWTLAMARASTADRVEKLSVRATNEHLVRLLDAIRAPEGTGKQQAPVEGPAAMPSLAREESGRNSLRRLTEDLLRLEGRAHPLLRPVVEEYRDVASDLATRKTRGADKRLAAAAELRKAILSRAEAVADMLNWFEATQIETPAFTDPPGSAPSRAVPPRADPLTLEIDSAQRSLSR